MTKTQKKSMPRDGQKWTIAQEPIARGLVERGKKEQISTKVVMPLATKEKQETRNKLIRIMAAECQPA